VKTSVHMALGLLPLTAWLCAGAPAAQPATFDQLAGEYGGQVRPLVVRFCLECHSTEKQEGELDLERFASLAEVRGNAKTWLKVAEMLDNGEMPPKDAKQPPPAERKQLRAWVERYLNAEAYASAGDPGPVVLRRLSNAQYTYTVQDLTAVPLEPLREFPADSAAGEGFTNTGSAMVMSPSLLTKYFDAGKQIADHAVLLPDGFRFSASTTPRDWTDEILARIRETYLRHSIPQGSTKVNLQGLTWESKEAGRLPLDAYLSATLEDRDSLASGGKSIESAAAARGLNARYLAQLWAMLNDKQRSELLDAVRARWRAAQPGDAKAMAAEIAVWQNVLTRFQSVGHMKEWMLPVNPIASRQEFRLKLAPPAGASEVTLYLAAGEAGDGSANDFVVWQQPRLVAPGRPDLLLRDVRDFMREMTDRRKRVFAGTAKSLLVVDEVSRAASKPDEKLDVAELARRYAVDADALVAWLDYFGVNSTAKPQLDYFTQKIEQAAGYGFVKGWGTQDTPSLMANSSDQHVRIPGNLKPHGLVVHPSPTLSAVVGWRSPIAGPVRIQGKVTHAHPECGNGVTWSLELRRGNTREVLASGTAAGNAAGSFGPIEQRIAQAGDFISLAVGPRDGNHACDLTDLELAIASPTGEDRVWNLARDVSDDVLAANPHADRFGNDGVWHFYTEPVKGNQIGPAIPGGSLLARWQAEDRAEERRKFAEGVERLLVDGPPADAKHPDALLYRQLASVGGPLLAKTFTPAPKPDTPAEQADRGASPAGWGPDPTLFGRHPSGAAVDAASLCVQAPSVLEIRLPAELVAESELVTAAVLHPETASEGSAQPMVVQEKPSSLAVLRPSAPVLTTDGSAARKRFECAFDDFRGLFPAALCYIRIVPVDEVVTLTLFHREDEPFCRLMLSDEQRASLDRMWDELHFVSHDALTLVDAFAQLMEYATQDSDPKLFEPYRKPIHDRAAAFRQAMLDAEPRHVEALLEFAARAYRRPLSDAETAELRGLYAKLRHQELPHEEAIRFTLARLFVAPDFLYRLEKAAPGAEPVALADWELANRLSYFLWSSLPDARLRDAAAAGRLGDADALAAEARRMLGDARVRRLADEFACQWLHIYDFRSLDEKSERHFPTFAALRGDMHEEAIRFFTDLFQRDASVLGIFNADHTFLNESLAKHYAIPGVSGPDWRRVDDVGQFGRGGTLGLAATLAKQSGASRTSPILRGNWVSEVLLGEKLPRPPKDVPRLPEDETATEGLTVRQLVEKHTSDPQCAGCHVRMDPFGYALEGFDAIGRRREKDLAERPVDTQARLQDGTRFQGLPGLRNYLVNTRRDAIVRQFNRKLLGYALGRSVQLSDDPLLQEMHQQLEKHDYRFSAAVETIVRSRQFREIRGKDAHIAEAR
jgi:Protein of unknown function (DUF1592)/Protein of unknown function (DUF1588)/Protein of unknown function (DUF1587)/Protein of unknown function (DUF1585)/Protein of unknown function (DUF1595)/Planctomycete cytochrome C